MAKSNGNVHLTSLDDLFTTQEQRDDAQREKVIDIPLDEIHDFPDHPSGWFRTMPWSKWLKASSSSESWFRRWSGPGRTAATN